MAHLIKLESGGYLNLEFVHMVDRDRGEQPSDQYYAYLSNGSTIRLSPKDLEKIEKIEKIAEYSDMEKRWAWADTVMRGRPMTDEDLED